MDEQERERWRGSVDADLRTIQENVRTLFRIHDQTDENLQKLEVKHTALAAKVFVFSAIGAILGSGLMTWLISAMKHH